MSSYDVEVWRGHLTVDSRSSLMTRKYGDDLPVDSRSSPMMWKYGGTTYQLIAEAAV